MSIKLDLYHSRLFTLVLFLDADVSYVQLTVGSAQRYGMQQIPE